MSCSRTQHRAPSEDPTGDLAIKSPTLLIMLYSHVSQLAGCLKEQNLLFWARLILIWIHMSIPIKTFAFFNVIMKVCWKIAAILLPRSYIGFPTTLIEPRHEKSCFLHMPKQRCRSDQLCRNCAADQRLCFHYIDSTIPLLF